MHLTDQIVSSDATIRAAMEVIDRSKIKMSVVVDKNERLIRVITDGDIRRAMLGGVELNDSIAVLPDKTPVACSVESGNSERLSVLQEHAVQALVLVDKDLRPVSLTDVAELGETTFLSPPHIGNAEFDYVRRAMDDNWVAPAGPNLEKFEEKLAEINKCTNALALSSGTAALHLALRVLNIQKGERVYTSDLTFVASIQPILYENAVPVLIDSEPDSWNMSPLALARQLERDKKNGSLPSAIIVVHLYGQSADMRSILDLANKYQIPVVEDAAESLGATYENRPSGSFGLLSAFSFNGNKIITTSGGGALVSDDKSLLDRARALSTQGRDNAEHYQHSNIAYNYRLSNILAGIGLGQLDLLPERVAARRAVFERYKEGFSDIKGVSFQNECDNSHGSRWLTVVEFDPDHIVYHPYQFMRRLRQKGIETRPAWKPMHLQPLCSSFEFEPHSHNQAVSSSLFLRSLCLPSGSSLSKDAQGRVVDAVRIIALEN